MINHHYSWEINIFLNFFRDFPICFRTFVGSSGTYPGVQNRSLGATFVKFWKFPKCGPKLPGAHGAHGPRPLGPIGPIFCFNICLWLNLIFICLSVLPIELPIELLIESVRQITVDRACRIGRPHVMLQGYRYRPWTMNYVLWTRVHGLWTLDSGP